MEPASETNATIAKGRKRLPVVLFGVVVVLLVGWGIGNLTSALEAYTSRQPGPGGFGRGILHGVLMPFSLPNLVVGQNVAIYQSDNVGRLYNLGYTMGVNCCGLVFFSYSFWRLKRLRKMLSK